MNTEPDLTQLQRVFMTVAGAVSVVGIGIFLSTQVDMSDPFVAGVYLVCCLLGILALRRFAKANVRGQTPREIWANFFGFPPEQK